MPEISGLGILTVVLAGTISFLSPCVLPLVPAYVSYIAGSSAGAAAPSRGTGGRLAALGLSTCFVLGFATVFVLLGASATALGRLLLGYRYELNLIGGAIVVVFGLFMLGLTRLPLLQREFRLHAAPPGGRAVSAYVLGLAFAFGWTPCIGPILGAILTTSAAAATVSEGVALLGLYSAGLGIPFLLAAIFTERLVRHLKSVGRIGRRLHQAAGVVVVAMGVAMMTGHLSALAYWLLDTFPILGSLG